MLSYNLSSTNARLTYNEITMNFIQYSIIILFSLFLSIQVSALSTDRDQPAEIEADDIEFDFQKGTRTYISNVLVVQGTLRLKADKVIANYEHNELAKATAWGSLARFKQRPDGKEFDTEGWAKKIIVDQKQNTITLIGKASVKQGANTAYGETIVYNMANDTMRMKGSAKVGAAGKDGSAPQKRILDDPFKDNAQGPAPLARKKQKKNKKNKKNKDGEDEDSNDEETEDIIEEEVEIEPVRAGRSRLIIQPK